MFNIIRSKIYKSFQYKLCGGCYKQLRLCDIKASYYYIMKYIFISFAVFIFTSLNGQVWLNNKIGVDDKAPYPWQPLSFKETSKGYEVLCWGRTYYFANTSVLSQAVAINYQLLQEPVSLYYGDNNLWKPVSKKIIKRSKNEVHFEFSSRLTDKAGKPINCRINVTVYYDGLIFYRIELSGTASLNEAISLKIPMKKDYTDIMHRWKSPTPSNKQWWLTEAFPATDQTQYVPYFWIGDIEKGLFWFAESPNNWTNYESIDAITFSGSKQSQVAASILNLTKANQLNSNTWSFEFGLQATPVKPLSNQKRNLILSGSPTSTVDVIWPDAGKAYQLKHFGYPEPSNLTAFNKHVLDIKNRGKKALVYNCLTYLSDASGEAIKFRSRWSIDAQPDIGSDVKAYTGAFARINITDQAYQDFIVWKSNQFLRNTKLDGYYLDNAMIVDINKSKIVKSFEGTRKKIPYYPIMTSRKLQERFYKMVKYQGADKLVILHSSAQILPPILAFGDAYVDGEQFRQDVARVDDDYLKMTNLIAFQSEFSGKPFGLSGIFLPVFNKENYMVSGPTRHLASILIQHDISAWPIFSAVIVWDEIRKALSSFPGYEQAEFIPYYAANNPFWKSTNSNMMISGYINNQNEYLCLVSNVHNNSGENVINFNRIDLSKYTIKQITGRGQLIKIGQNRLSIRVLPKDYFIFYLSRNSN